MKTQYSLFPFNSLLACIYQRVEQILDDYRVREEYLIIVKLMCMKQSEGQSINKAINISESR